MTSGHGFRPISADDGVSSVVAAVILLGLFVTMLGLYTVQTLPGRIADRERAHNDAAVAEFARLSRELEALSLRGEPGPASVTIDTRPTRVVPFQSSVLASPVGAGRPFEASWAFEDAQVLFVDGALAGDAAPLPATLAEVHALLALSVGLSSTEDWTSPSSADLGFVRVEATDGERTVTVRLVHRENGGDCTTWELALHVEVASPGGSSAQRHLLGCVGPSVDGYRVDLLRRGGPAASALATLASPFTVTVTEGMSGSDAAGEVAAVWRTAGGRLEALGSATPQHMALAWAGNGVRMDATYQHFVDQDIVWEGGAVLRTQGTRGAVVAGPAMALRAEPAGGSLEWTVASVDARGGSSAALAAVAVTHLRSAELLLQAEGATLTVTTAHPEAWAALLRTKALASGAGADAAVTTGDGTATLTLGSAAVDGWVFRLRHVEATATVG